MSVKAKLKPINRTKSPQRNAEQKGSSQSPGIGHNSGARVLNSVTEIVTAVRAVEEALRESDGGLWRIGDLLIRECGKPGTNHANNGATAKLKHIAEVLKRAGFPKYSVVYLKKLRSTASTFEEDNRLSSVPWTVHLAAGDPKTLHDAKVAAERQNKVLTVSFVKQLTAKHPKPDIRKLLATFLVAAQNLREAATEQLELLPYQDRVRGCAEATEVASILQPPRQISEAAAE